MNVVRQVADKYWLIEREVDRVVGIIVWLENGVYRVYVDDREPMILCNRTAAIEYAQGVSDAAMVSAA